MNAGERDVSVSGVAGRELGYPHEPREVYQVRATPPIASRTTSELRDRRADAGVGIALRAELRSRKSTCLRIAEHQHASEIATHVLPKWKSRLGWFTLSH